jgi:hypothetical protein
MSWTRDPDMKMIVVWKRAVRLLHHFSGSDARGERRANSLSVGEEPCPQRRGYENMSHVRWLVAHQGSHERPVLRVVEVRAWPADRRPVSAELNEMAS